jgi:hypothetical protein
MRDGRPATTTAGAAQETANNEKLKDVTLTAKTEIVYEEPGEEKGVFRRVADKTPILSHPLTTGKKAPTPESPTELAAKKNTSAKEDLRRCLGKSMERNKSLRRPKTTARSRRKPPRRMTNW